MLVDLGLFFLFSVKQELNEFFVCNYSRIVPCILLEKYRKDEWTFVAQPGSSPPCNDILVSTFFVRSIFVRSIPSQTKIGIFEPVITSGELRLPYIWCVVETRVDV